MPPESEGWERGVYFLSSALRVGLIAIHQLPNIPETMWLRILGRGRVQQEAITELTTLPVDNRLRANALELLYNLQANLQANLANNTEESTEDRELVMAIAPLFQEQLQAAQQQGIQQGRQEQQRLILENFLLFRFGKLDPKMRAFLSTVSTVPAAEFTVMLLGISMLTVDEAGRQQAVRLLAENVLRMRVNEGGDILSTLVTNLLALSAEELALFLERSLQLSANELMALLGQEPR